MASVMREPAEREWARLVEARNVRAGGADPPRRHRNIEFRPPMTDGIRYGMVYHLSLAPAVGILWV